MRWSCDLRVEEIKRCLNSSQPVRITLQQKPEVNDHQFIEEKQRYLLALCQRTMALPVGRYSQALPTNSINSSPPLSPPATSSSAVSPPATSSSAVSPPVHRQCHLQQPIIITSITVTNLTVHYQRYHHHHVKVTPAELSNSNTHSPQLIHSPSQEPGQRATLPRTVLVCENHLA